MNESEEAREMTATEWAGILQERVVNAINGVHAAVLAEALEQQRKQYRVRIGEVESLRGRVAELEGMLEKSQESVSAYSEFVRDLARAFDWSTVSIRLPDVLNHVRHLVRWKKEHMLVESQWNPPSVGTKLGMTLGMDIRPNIEPAIDKLIAERDCLTSQVEAYKGALLCDTAMWRGLCFTARQERDQWKAEAERWRALVQTPPTPITTTSITSIN